MALNLREDAINDLFKAEHSQIIFKSSYKYLLFPIVFYFLELSITEVPNFLSPSSVLFLSVSFSFFFKDIYFLIYLSVYVNVCEGTHRGQKWVQGTELCFFAVEVSNLKLRMISPATPLSFIVLPFSYFTRC